VLLGSISSSATSQVADHGFSAVFVLMAIDALFPLVSELVMLYAGAIAVGAFSTEGVHVFGHEMGFGAGALVVLAIAGTLGYLAGSLLGWAVGRYGGRPLIERHGRWFHLSPERLDRAERWFDRWGQLGVALGRITPIVRSFVSIPAGVFELPLLPYTLLTLLGSAIWAFALAGVGYGVGAGYKRFDHAFHYAEYAVVAGIALGLAYLVYRRMATAKVAPRADDSSR
jgi:membrane protein DedA with SNARE-associated domain